MNVVADDGTHVKIELCRSTLISGARVRLGVTGSSMLPALWPGDLVDVRLWTADDLRIGAIVVFERERRLVVHRIRGVLERAPARVLITRGDAQCNIDPPVPLPNLLGVVETVRRSGARHVPRRRPHVAAVGMAWLVRRSEWVRRVSLRLYLLRRERLTTLSGTSDGH